MTALLLELAALPVEATLDGEICALGEDGSPDFPLICEGMLMRRAGIRVTYMIFDLTLEPEDLTSGPYSERRAGLQELDLNGDYWQTRERFDDGESVFQAVCEHELEGVVAKRKGAATGQVNGLGEG